VHGTDNALQMNIRAPGAASWQGWHRAGGVLTSVPTAGVFLLLALDPSVFIPG
jgi:hypothetical protein